MPKITRPEGKNELIPLIWIVYAGAAQMWPPLDARGRNETYFRKMQIIGGATKHCQCVTRISKKQWVLFRHWVWRRPRVLAVAPCIPLRIIAQLVGVKTEDTDNTCWEYKLRYPIKSDAGVMCRDVNSVLCNSYMKWSAKKTNSEEWRKETVEGCWWCGGANLRWACMVPPPNHAKHPF